MPKLTLTDLKGLTRDRIELLAMRQADRICELETALATLRSGLVYKAMQSNLDERDRIIRNLTDRGWKNMEVADDRK